MRKTLLPCLLLLSGCVHYMPIAVSTAPMGPKEHPLTVASGESSASYFLFFGPFGDDSIQAAVKDAVGTKADTLLNAFADRQLFCFPTCGFSVYTQITTKVYGTLVKYDDPLFARASSAEMAPSTESISTSINGLAKGSKIRITLKDKREITGVFESLDRSRDVLWVKTGDSVFGNDAYNVRSILKVESIQ